MFEPSRGWLVESIPMIESFVYLLSPSLQQRSFECLSITKIVEERTDQSLPSFCSKWPDTSKLHRYIGCVLFFPLSFSSLSSRFFLRRRLLPDRNNVHLVWPEFAWLGFRTRWTTTATEYFSQRIDAQRSSFFRHIYLSNRQTAVMTPRSKITRPPWIYLERQQQQQPSGQGRILFFDNW